MRLLLAARGISQETVSDIPKTLQVVQDQAKMTDHYVVLLHLAQDAQPLSLTR